MPEYPIASPARLRRRIGLPLLILYGTRVAVGAGIYILIGEVVGHAQVYSSWAFALAAAVMAFTAASLCRTRHPLSLSAGEDAYVRAAFDSRTLSTAVRLLKDRHRHHAF